MADGQTHEGKDALLRLLRARKGKANGADAVPVMPPPAPPTPAKAAATALGRAADRLYQLPVEPDEVQVGAATLAELPELVPEGALLAVLQGPGDAVAMAALCPEAVTALIEIQTLGRVTGRPVERRKLTRADAMLCADFINATLTELASELGPMKGFSCLTGFRYATHLTDLRPLLLMLDDKPHRSLLFQLRLGGAQTRQARIFMAFPQREAAIAPPPRPAPASEGPAPAPDPARVPSLAAAVREAPVEVVGVLCRRRITLGELRALAPGQMLPLPRVSLSEARLETTDGQLLSVGKFGKSDGCHAIRLYGRSDAAGDDVDLASPDEFRSGGGPAEASETGESPAVNGTIVANGRG